MESLLNIRDRSLTRCAGWTVVLAVVSLAVPIRASATVADATGPAVLTVHVATPGPRVSPTLWGIFFEDINCSADGGIYAELVRNRSFEDAATPVSWSLLTRGATGATMTVDGSAPASAKNPHALKLTIPGSAEGAVSLVNEGFWGMAVRKGEAYELTVLARRGAGSDGPIGVALKGSDRRTLAAAAIPAPTETWRPYRVTLTASATDPKARLQITPTKAGMLWLDMVSLFPKATWKGRPGGLRPDLAEMLLGLRPSFVRFPGGCWVEGDTMGLAYRWKQTIGDPSERRTQHNIWDYEATHGLGFHEYLQMCEDLGARPLFVINCGMSHREVVPIARMSEFVQDALDAIEYGNGPAASPWGSVRAKNGHPAPFHLQFMEIGNENGGPAYQERYALFHDAIKKRYPEIKLVANVPTTTRKPEIVDEHYYSNPEFFMSQADRYDSYDRKGPKIYVGEYAVTADAGKGNLRGAIGEAAFMTGMERNSDVVVMASYAPLFVNVNHRGWNPDLIDYDSARVYGIPSYHVQKLFSENRGDVVLPVDVQAAGVAPPSIGGGVGVGTWLTKAEFKDIKVTRGDETLYAADPAQGTKGWRLHGGHWAMKDGALQQTSLADNVRAIIGDRSWTDTTLTLKARKLAGAEGFLILFGVKNDDEKSWWNIGGWGNNHHAIEMGGVVGRDVPGRIETGRWYDIRVELKGASIKCFLDGKLVHDAKRPSLKSLYASATRVDSSGDVILKVVNTAPGAIESAVRLDGVTAIDGAVRAVVLTAPSPTDENTLEQPTKVAPVPTTVEVKGNVLRHSFPGNSLTVIRVRPAAR
jgi:alpha-L-arabinofuranosidase